MRLNSNATGVPADVRGSDHFYPKICYSLHLIQCVSMEEGLSDLIMSRFLRYCMRTGEYDGGQPGIDPAVKEQDLARKRTLALEGCGTLHESRSGINIH